MPDSADLARVRAQHDRVQRLVPPAAQAACREASRRLHGQLSVIGRSPDPHAAVLERAGLVTRGKFAALAGMAGLDIEAIAFLILMEMAKSAQEDLKAIMEGVKSTNAQKAAMRDALRDARGKASTAGQAVPAVWAPWWPALVAQAARVERRPDRCLFGPC